MSRQQGGNGNGDVARGAGYAAILGAVLIGVAVVVGIVLLQIGDRNDNGPAAVLEPDDAEHLQHDDPEDVHEQTGHHHADVPGAASERRERDRAQRRCR